MYLFSYLRSPFLKVFCFILIVHCRYSVLRDQPSGMIEGDDEMIVSLGYECSPSGLCFKKPVKITFPHAGLFLKPREVETVLYTGHGEYRPGMYLDNDFTEVNNMMIRVKILIVQ